MSGGAASSEGSAGPRVRVERTDGVATVTVDRPPLNILDIATLEELAEAVASLRHPPVPRLVVVRGGGERAFSAGVAVEDHTPEKVPEMLATFHRSIRLLHGFDALTLAAVRGHCLGGGLELALACDFILAEAGARFGLPEVELGCFPPVAAALLPRRIGRSRTLELLVTGRTMDAAEAMAHGLVTWRCGTGELDARLAELTADLTAASPAVTPLIQRAVYAGERLEFDDALAEAERLYLEELAETRDMREGLEAFLEKREPEWEGR